MQEKDYFLYIDGQPVRVSEEIYREYRHSEDKEQYFMERLKKGRYVADKDSHKTVYIPSREVSFERLVEEMREPQNQEESLDDRMIRAMLIRQLVEALHRLSDEELELVREIFWQEKTERELGRKYHVSQMTIHNRKNRILEKLRKFL